MHLACNVKEEQKKRENLFDSFAPSRPESVKCEEYVQLREEMFLPNQIGKKQDKPPNNLLVKRTNKINADFINLST